MIFFVVYLHHCQLELTLESRQDKIQTYIHFLFINQEYCAHLKGRLGLKDSSIMSAGHESHTISGWLHCHYNSEDHWYSLGHRCRFLLKQDANDKISPRAVNNVQWAIPAWQRLSQPLVLTAVVHVCARHICVQMQLCLPGSATTRRRRSSSRSLLCRR